MREAPVKADSDKAKSEEALPWRTVLTLVGIILAVFMAALEMTVVQTAMPTVVATLGGFEQYSWVYVAYVLFATIMTPIWGKMADLVGRRPAFFWGMACFLVGSALSGAAQSMWQLIVFRALQGLGSGAIFPVGLTMMADLLTLERRAKVLGFFSGVWGVASLFGPLAGGYLTDRLSWRWVFYINVPVGLLASAMVWATYHERRERPANVSLDYAGAVVLAVGLTLLLFAVERGNDFAPATTALLALACLALAALFVFVERRSREPLIPLDIFHSRMVVVTTLHGLFSGICLFGTISFLPLFVQAVMGTSATEAGTILTPLILAWVGTALLSGRLMLRFGYRHLVIAGMALFSAGAALLATVSEETTRAQLMRDVILMGLGSGLMMPTLTLAAQRAAARSRIGVVTSMTQFSRSIGGALGAGIMGAVTSWSVNRALGTGYGAEMLRLSGAHVDVAALVRGGTRAALAPDTARFLQQVLASGLRLAFICGLASAFLATLAAFFTPGGRAEDVAHPEHH
jgi:EmrB/QacA subfamily drug resistance transporter